MGASKDAMIIRDNVEVHKNRLSVFVTRPQHAFSLLSSTVCSRLTW